MHSHCLTHITTASSAAESIALLAVSLTESPSCQSLAWRSDVRVQPILIFDVYDTVNSRFKIAGHKIVSENKSTHMKVGVRFQVVKAAKSEIKIK